jgi:CMP-N-acetylneuraminic acid synthetase
MKNLKILALIPARGNSKRIKNKNLRNLNGKPLIFWSIDAAKKSKYIKEICVTSDSQAILEYSKKKKIKTILRPKKLANDIIHAEKAMIHAYQFLNEKFDYVIMLQPTSPLRATKHIDEAIEKIYYSKKDSLLSVYKNSYFIWKKSKNNFHPINYDLKKRPRHQDVNFYQENGAIYITKPNILLQNKNRLGGKIDIFVMDKNSSLDIDNLNGLKKANDLMKKNIN